MNTQDCADDLIVPPPDVLAFFIRFQRGMKGWKQGTLAAQAGVSLTTIQRVERGEAVAKESLDKIGCALGHQLGIFTLPRRRNSEAESLDLVIKSLSWVVDTVPVKVAPLRKEPQLRDVLNATSAFLDSDLSPEIDEDLEALREWMDFASWMTASAEGFIGPPPRRTFKKRKLYADIFAHVGMMERKYRAVCLAGSYEATTNMVGFEKIRVGVLAFRSKDSNPAAIAMQELRAPPSVDLRKAVQKWLSEDA